MARPGRPPLDADDPSVPVSFSLPSKEFDALCRRARRADVTLSAIIRRDLRDATRTVVRVKAAD